MSKYIFPTMILSLLLLFALETAGSLFKEGGWGDDLYRTPTARKAGDLVTVLIVQNSRAQQRSEASDQKGARLSGRADIASGTGFLKFIKGAGSNLDFRGSSQHGREKRVLRQVDLIAKVTARVVEVTPDGNLKIEGSQHININGEKLEVYISGVIRPEDIAPDNTILSTSMGDAQIEYRDPFKPPKKHGRVVRTLLLPIKAAAFLLALLF